MTRKDYIAIAEALRYARSNALAERIPEFRLAVDGVMDAAEHIANAMQDDNPRFDREHFLAVVRGTKGDKNVKAF